MKKGSELGSMCTHSVGFPSERRESVALNTRHETNGPFPALRAFDCFSACFSFASSFLPFCSAAFSCILLSDQGRRSNCRGQKATNTSVSEGQLSELSFVILERTVSIFFCLSDNWPGVDVDLRVTTSSSFPKQEGFVFIDGIIAWLAVYYADACLVPLAWLEYSRSLRDIRS